MTSETTDADPNQICQLNAIFESESKLPLSQKSQQTKTIETVFRWLILSK